MAQEEQRDQPAKNNPTSNPWAAQLAKLGNVAGPVADDVAYLWPENVETWHYWLELRNQWMVGFGGPYALNLVAVATHLTECGLTGDKRREIYDGIRACADATLAALAEAREKQLQAAG